MMNIKKERPEGGASRRSVQGLAPENDCNSHYNRFLGKCKPPQGGGDFSMTGWGFFFMLL